MNKTTLGQSEFYPFDALPLQIPNEITALKTNGIFSSSDGVMFAPPLLPNQAFDLRHNVKAMVLSLPAFADFPINEIFDYAGFTTDTVLFVSGDCIVKRYIINNSASAINSLYTNQYNNIKFKAKSPKNWTNVAVKFILDFSVGYWGFVKNTIQFSARPYFRPAMQYYVPAVTPGYNSFALAANISGYSSQSPSFSLDGFRYQILTYIPYYIKDFSTNSGSIDFGPYIIDSGALMPSERIDDIYFNPGNASVGDQITIFCPACNPKFDNDLNRVGFADLKEIHFTGANPVTKISGKFELMRNGSTKVYDAVRVYVPPDTKTGPIGFYMVEKDTQEDTTSDYFETLTPLIII
jgi:hypothetical protein